MPPPLHLRPAADLAERCLLPGDPGRALALAQDLLETPPRMFNHHRGLWGYTGTAVSMGNPHFIIFVDEITDNHVLVDGPLLEKAPQFPKKTNVEFVCVLDRSSVEMRVWERGSGETLTDDRRGI